VEVFDLDQNEAYALVVMGVPDPAKGESLVVLTTMELNPNEVREKLLGAGFAALWVPRLVHRVEKIPVSDSRRTRPQGVQAARRSKPSRNKTTQAEQAYARAGLSTPMQGKFR